MTHSQSKLGRFAADFDNESGFDALHAALTAAGLTVENRTWDNDCCPKLGVGPVDIFVECKDVTLRDSGVENEHVFYGWKWDDESPVDIQFDTSDVAAMVEWVKANLNEKAA
jgi:hypothetical protein